MFSVKELTELHHMSGESIENYRYIQRENQFLINDNKSLATKVDSSQELRPTRSLSLSLDSSASLRDRRATHGQTASGTGSHARTRSQPAGAVDLPVVVHPCFPPV